MLSYLDFFLLNLPKLGPLGILFDQVGKQASWEHALDRKFPNRYQIKKKSG